MVAAPIYITTNSVGGFPFFYTLSSIYNLYTFFGWVPCGMQNFPDLESNLCPMQWKHRVLTTRPPESPYYLQTFWWWPFWLVRGDGYRYLTVVLICISFILSNVEHLFMWLMAIWICFLEKCSFRSSAWFLVQLFVCFDIELYELLAYFGN